MFVTSVSGKISREQATQFGNAVGAALETLRGFKLTEEECALMLLSSAYGHAKTTLHHDPRKFLGFCEHVVKCIERVQPTPLIIVPGGSGS